MNILAKLAECMRIRIDWEMRNVFYCYSAPKLIMIIFLISRNMIVDSNLIDFDRIIDIDFIVRKPLSRVTKRKRLHSTVVGTFRIEVWCVHIFLVGSGDSEDAAAYHGNVTLLFDVRVEEAHCRGEKQKREQRRLKWSARIAIKERTKSYNLCEFI